MAILVFSTSQGIDIMVHLGTWSRSEHTSWRCRTDCWRHAQFNLGAQFGQTVIPTACWVLQGGLSKLAEAESTVDELGTEAQEQRVALTAKQAEVDEAMEAIEAAMNAAGSRKAEVERLSAEQEQASQVAVERKVRCCLQPACVA